MVKFKSARIGSVFLSFLVVLMLYSSCSAEANTSSSKSSTTQTASTITDKNTNKTYKITTNYSGCATSFSKRTDDYSVGYYISDGKAVPANSLLTESDQAVSSLDLNLSSNGSGFSPVIATGQNTKLALTGTIQCQDTTDGSNASDFTGLGTQIIAADHANIDASNMNINTTGFVRDAFIVDNHAQALIKNSKITTMGANSLTQIYSGYKNSADQSVMISPPWVLGIQGGARLANVLGDNATLSVINSTLTSGSWAVLSTDACTNPVINVIDSTLSILPESKGGMSSGNFSYSKNYGSGYGSYLIGNATENFYGTSISGTTYGAVLCGGTATYQSSNGTITLKNADDGTVGSFTGKNKASTIDSVFGFMSHNNGTVNVLDGTKVNSQDAVFLYKAGDVTFNANNASLNSQSGVLLQMMDNDDSTVGATESDGNPIFNTTFSETKGWPSENGNVTSSSSSSSSSTSESNSETANLNLTNGKYTGNVYNGTGYYTQSGDTLNVTLGTNATLNGAISLTETRHVDENGDQNTSFTMNQYYYLGHVENRVYNNGNSQIAVTLTDGAKWTVTGKSCLTSLTVKDGTIQAEEGKTLTMTVNGTKTPIVSGKTYQGDIVLSVA